MLDRSAVIRRAFALTVLVSAVSVPSVAHAEAAAPAAQAQGVLRATSMHDVEETVSRIKAAVQSKGIRFFAAIDHQQLGAAANLPIAKSVLVMFGNPPLGVQFIQANPYAGLDWPVRMLVRETPGGGAEIAWTDFAFIGQRYGITGKDAQLKMASEVAAAIAEEAGH
jgi:uncharacterized protein (DUF302 family)